MKKIYLISVFLGLFSTMVFADETPKHVTLHKTQGKTPPTTKPHAPSRAMVEVWIEDNLLAISFLEPEGEAILTVTDSESLSEWQYIFSTDMPFMLDLTPMPNAESITIETTAGNTYTGYLP